MIRAIVFAATLVVGALALCSTVARADIQVGSYNGRCDYRCCDANNNCAVYYFYTGSGQGVWNTPCTWEAVCSQQGDIGWSASPYPMSKQNSSLSYTKGCWKGMEAGQYGGGKYYVKAC